MKHFMFGLILAVGFAGQAQAEGEYRCCILEFKENKDTCLNTEYAVCKASPRFQKYQYKQVCVSKLGDPPNCVNVTKSTSKVAGVDKAGFAEMIEQLEKMAE